MIYANPVEQARLIQEFQNLDRGIPPQAEMSSLAPIDHPAPQIKTKEKGMTETDFFESGLIPQSTVIYPIQGARINEIRIYNSKGREVNNLLAGQEYQFEIHGTFLEERDLVSIGMHIRAMTGVEITAQQYPSFGRYIHNVKSGQKFKLVHKVMMILTPGTYFVGGGVSSSTEPVQMHRILDAIMFRVLPKAERSASGHVDLSVGEPEFMLDEAIQEM